MDDPTLSSIKWLPGLPRTGWATSSVPISQEPLLFPQEREVLGQEEGMLENMEAHRREGHTGSLEGLEGWGLLAAGAVCQVAVGQWFLLL